MADYNGDTSEDIAMNEAFTDHWKDPSEHLVGNEEFVAVDYFKWGWEAAMKFIEEGN